jgi:FAD binding domain
MSLPSLPDALRDRAVTPGDRQYAALRSTYTKVAAPAMVLLPRSAQEVAEAVRYAGDSDLAVSVRSGGHGLSGRSSNDGGIVIDLSAINSVHVLDAKARLVRVGAGARWAHVAAALEPEGLVISSGDHGNVGVGGLATAGGIGWLARAYGLTIDHVRAAQIVLSDGTVIRADRDREPDLFWAIRGAGEWVGIVTGFEIEAMPLTTIGVAQIAIEADREGAALRRWSEYLTQAPRDLTVNGVILPAGDGFILQLTAVVASEDPDRIRALVEPVARLGGKVLSLQAQLAPYTALMPTGHIHQNVGQQPSTTTNALLPTLTADSARALMDVAAHASGPLVQLRSLGGAINDIDSGETAYPHRSQQALAIFSNFPPEGGRELIAATRTIWPFAEGAYRNFESHPDEQTFQRAFPGMVGQRVTSLHQRYDPAGLLQRASTACLPSPRA